MDPQLFEKAVRLVRIISATSVASSASLLTQNDKLKLYALYKQATVGKCTGPRPSFFDIEGKAKYAAWSDLADLPRTTAMCQYVELVLEKAMALQALLSDDPSGGSLDDPEGLLERLRAFKQECAELWPERFAHLRSPDASEVIEHAYQDEEATSYADIETNPSYGTPLISEAIGAPIAENIASLLSPMSHSLASDHSDSAFSTSGGEEEEEDPLHVKEPHPLDASAESIIRRPGLGSDTHECLWQILDRLERLELTVEQLQDRLRRTEDRARLKTYLGLSLCAVVGLCTSSLLYYSYSRAKLSQARRNGS